MKKDFRELIVEIGRRTSKLRDIDVDFAKMSERLKVKYHINLAERSLQKLFACLKSAEKPRRETLDRLSLFAGFQSWDELQHAFMGE